jgi:hypothetical protein
VAHNAFLVWVKEGDFAFLGGFLEELHSGGHRVLDIEELNEWVGTPRHCFIIIVDSEKAANSLTSANIPLHTSSILPLSKAFLI